MTDGNHSCGQIFGHYRSCPNLDVVAQRDRANHHGVGAKFDVIADARAVALTALTIGHATNRDALAQGAVLADDRSPINHDAVRMIQLQPIANARSPRQLNAKYTLVNHDIENNEGEPADLPQRITAAIERRQTIKQNRDFRFDAAAGFDLPARPSCPF